MTDFKTNITNHLTELVNFYKEELVKAEKDSDENPRTHWAKIKEAEVQKQLQTYNAILTNIKVGEYDEQTRFPIGFNHKKEIKLAF